MTLERSDKGFERPMNPLVSSIKLPVIAGAVKKINGQSAKTLLAIHSELRPVVRFDDLRFSEFDEEFLQLINHKLGRCIEIKASVDQKARTMI